MGVAHGLRPVHLHTVRRKAGKRQRKGFDFVNDRQTVFLKNAVRSALYTKAEIFEIFPVREKHLRLIPLSRFFLQTAMNFRAFRRSFQRISPGTAVQISAAQQELHQPAHRKLDLLHRPSPPRFLPV